MRKVSTRKETAEDRKSPRLYMQANAVLDAGAGKRFDVQVVNLSAHGMMIETPTRLAPGRPVAVELLKLGRVTGKVAWIADGNVGISFGKPLTLDQLSAFF